MRSRILVLTTTIALFAALGIRIRLGAQDQQQQKPDKLQHYTVTDLGTLGGTSSVAVSINNEGWVTGISNLQGNQDQHAFLWQKGVMSDLGTLGGPNSAVNFPVKDDSGKVVGVAETSVPDPLREQFCSGLLGWVDGHTCLGFISQEGVMTPLPTLGGNNGVAAGVNNRGQVVGFAENSTQDSTCIAPQVLQFEAVIWGPKEGQIRQLPPLPGDPDGAAAAINDNGQIAGCSGTCANVTGTSCVHAVIWQNGSVTDLGSLGGKMGNVALANNNQGQVVGASDLPGDTTFHAFLWTQDDGMQDLGTLPGDFSSGALGINDKGQVVGSSCDQSGNCRAFLWQDGVMTDLNALIPPGSSSYLLVGEDINSRGEIVGQAFDQSTGDTPAFLAVPEAGSSAAPLVGDATKKIILPENVRDQLRKRRGFGRFGAWPIRPQ